MIRKAKTRGLCVSALKNSYAAERRPLKRPRRRDGFFATTRFFPELDQLANLLGSLWFLAIVAYGTHYIADLPLPKAAVASFSGYVGWIIIQAIRTGFSLF